MKEELGKEEVFDSFESNIQEDISVEKAKEQEKKAEEVREGKAE